MQQKKKRRNARPQPARRRNATPAAPATPRAASKAVPAPPKKKAWLRLAETTAATVGTSMLGAVLTRIGMGPRVIAVAAATGGGLLALRDAESRFEDVYMGVAQAGASQLTLQWLKPSEPPPAPSALAIAANQNQAPAAKPAGIRQAALGAFSPGELEAAFQRSQAELALGQDIHAHAPHGFGHEQGYGYAA